MLNCTRLVKVVMPLTLPASLYLTSGRVFAASENENEESHCCLITDELSLYTTPHTRVHNMKPTVSQVEQTVSSLRKSAEPYTTWGQEKTSNALYKAEEYYKVIEPVMNTSVHTMKDMYEFLINPPAQFYPSVSAVGFSAILGLYLSKGGRVKRLLYPTGLMILSTSMFYPLDTATLAKEAKNQIFRVCSQTRVLLEDVWKGNAASKEK